jgi:hypothetical protein
VREDGIMSLRLRRVKPILKVMILSHKAAYVLLLGIINDSPYSGSS